jgi:hypothetical protein
MPKRCLRSSRTSSAHERAETTQSGNDRLSEADRYAVSIEFLTGVAKQEGTDAWLNTHAY